MRAGSAATAHIIRDRKPRRIEIPWLSHMPYTSTPRSVMVSVNKRVASVRRARHFGYCMLSEKDQHIVENNITSSIALSTEDIPSIETHTRCIIVDPS